ncbi:MAG: hypothetical protein WBD09_00505 [Halobacteriota archaeon]
MDIERAKRYKDKIKYNQLDDLVAFISVKELLPGIDEFVEVVEQWMRKILGEK